MKIKVSVPATSANIGSGFDALGLAVTLYNTVTFEESEVLDISSADGTRIPRGESNLVYRSAKGLFEKVGKQIPPLKITQTNPIPMARGLVLLRPASSRVCWVPTGCWAMCSTRRSCSRWPPPLRATRITWPRLFWAV